MAHITIHQTRARVHVPLEYECESCGLQMDVMVHGMGMAGGVFADHEEHAERAKTWAWKSAFMRCELWPCPNCGHRTYDLWRREWIRAAFLTLLATLATAAIWYFVDSRAFRRDETLMIMAGIALFFQLLVGGAMLYELRAAKSAVRPRANDGTDTT